MQFLLPYPIVGVELWGHPRHVAEDFVEGAFVFEATALGNTVEGMPPKISFAYVADEFLNSVGIDKRKKVGAAVMIDYLTEVFGVCIEADGKFAQRQIGVDEELLLFHCFLDVIKQPYFVEPTQTAGPVAVLDVHQGDTVFVDHAVSVDLEREEIDEFIGGVVNWVYDQFTEVSITVFAVIGNRFLKRFFTRQPLANALDGVGFRLWALKYLTRAAANNLAKFVTRYGFEIIVNPEDVPSGIGKNNGNLIHGRIGRTTW